MTPGVDLAVVADAGRVYGDVYDVAAAAVRRLAETLTACGGMGGSDEVAQSWSATYDELCGASERGSSLLDSAAAAINGAAQCVDLLYNAEVNHRYADREMDSANAPAFSLNAKALFVAPAVPSAAGLYQVAPGDRGTPGPGIPEQSWPSGDLKKLRSAAQAWHAAASELRIAAELANGPVRSVRRQKSPELRLAAAYCAKVRDALAAVAHGCDAAAKTCFDYANAVSETRSKIGQEFAGSSSPSTISRRARLKRRLGL